MRTKKENKMEVIDLTVIDPAKWEKDRLTVPCSMFEIVGKGEPFTRENYQATKVALMESDDGRVCWDWACYAKGARELYREAGDEALLFFRNAERIRLLATRQVGVFLSKFDGRGRPPKDNSPGAGDYSPSQLEVAKEIRMSSRQRDNATRLAKIPIEEFERLIEASEPPTLRELLDWGKEDEQEEEKDHTRLEKALIEEFRRFRIRLKKAHGSCEYFRESTFRPKIKEVRKSLDAFESAMEEVGE